MDELNAQPFGRRIVFSQLQEGTTVEARYADRQPAVIAMRNGRGRVVLLTTTPDPAWSDLGKQAAGLLTWLHTLLRDALGPPDTAAMFVSPRGVTPRVRRPARSQCCSRDASERKQQCTGDDPAVEWRADAKLPTAQPGIYAVQASTDGAPELRYAVNWPAEESDLRPIAADRITALLGVARVSVEQDAVGDAAGGQPHSALGGMADAARFLPFLLIACVVGELLLAARDRRLSAAE